MLLVALIGRTEYRICRIEADTALKAATRLNAAVPLHLDFINQIIGTLMQVRKAVDHILT
jgi:hypothetical protein